MLKTWFYVNTLKSSFQDTIQENILKLLCGAYTNHIILSIFSKLPFLQIIFLIYYKNIKNP